MIFRHAGAVLATSKVWQAICTDTRTAGQDTGNALNDSVPYVTKPGKAVPRCPCAYCLACIVLDWIVMCSSLSLVFEFTADIVLQRLHVVCSVQWFHLSTCLHSSCFLYSSFRAYLLTAHDTSLFRCTLWMASDVIDLVDKHTSFWDHNCRAPTFLLELPTLRIRPTYAQIHDF